MSTQTTHTDTKPEPRRSLTFYLTPTQRRIVERKLKPLAPSRADALLIALGLSRLTQGGAQ